MGDEFDRAEDDTDDDPSWTAFRDRYINPDFPPRGTFRMTDKSPAQLQAELAVAQAQLAALQAAEVTAPSRWPAEPPIGTVIRFERTFSRNTRDLASLPEQTYTYVAVRTPRASKPWYITGFMGRDNKSWPDLCRMIGDSALCQIATAWFEVPPLEPVEPAPAQDVSEFVAMFDRSAEPAPIDLDAPGD